jgi:DegV family protein with EDD domain
MTVTIITDSAASLPEHVVRHHGIVVVPLRLAWGGQDVRDGEVEVAELLRGIEGPASTSGPPPGEFADAIDAAGPDGAVVLSIASSMSSTCDAARVGAQAASRPAVVVDTGTAAGAEGLVVLAAADAAAAGASLGEVEAVARDVARRVRLAAAVDSLAYLVRSGRVPQVAGWAGKVLGLHPLFEFRDGQVKRLLPATGREAAVEAVIRRWRLNRPADHALHLAVLHAVQPECAAVLLERVEQEVSPKTSFVGEFSAAMAVHTGPLVGLAWWYEPAGGATDDPR